MLERLAGRVSAALEHLSALGSRLGVRLTPVANPGLVALICLSMLAAWQHLVRRSPKQPE